MKQKILLCLTILVIVTSIFTTSIFAEDVEIKIITESGIVIKKIDSEIESWLLSSVTSNPEIIFDISGLEQLEKLSVIEIPILKYTGNYEFLTDCKNLKRLYLNGGTITSFKFLEKMKNLEYVELNMYINNEDLEKIYSEKINFVNLKQINEIRFFPIVTNLNKTSSYYKIPNFVNVKNNAKLFLGNNEIESISDSDIELLKQYSEVYLWPNPILENPKELEKLKKVNWKGK